MAAAGVREVSQADSARSSWRGPGGVRFDLIFGTAGAGGAQDQQHQEPARRPGSKVKHQLRTSTRATWGMTGGTASLGFVVCVLGLF